MRIVISLLIFVFVTGCISIKKITKYTVALDCKYKNKIELRKIESTVMLTQEEILTLIPTVENKFEYMPGSCKQN